MSGLRPIIKPFSETVSVAAHMFDLSHDEACVALMRRMRKVGLSVLDVEIYVNWASHNALTRDEIAYYISITKKRVHSGLERVRREFPHLFIRG